MRVFEITMVVVLSAASLLAQQPGPAIPMKDFASSADVAALIAQAKSEHKDGQPLLLKPILTLAPINANLEYRTAVAPAAVHETEAEIFYVIDGSGTMVTGGQLIGEKRLNAENLNGTGVTNGSSRRVAKGDFIIVPQGVPHWFSKIDGTLVLMSLHVPRKSDRASAP
jgi:mannose-6-phosphate isomerase-like protein (cupin superfamily)